MPTFQEVMREFGYIEKLFRVPQEQSKGSVNLVRNVILQKKIISVLMHIILLQSFACGMEIAERTRLDVSVNSELLKACIAGDSLGIVSLLAEGADINAKGKTGMTALLAAVYGGHKAIVELLISSGADFNTKDEDGWTALYSAAARGHKEIAELLIKNGADVSAKNNDGWTALYLAAINNHKEIVELLIAKGANVNAKGNSGATALHLAVKMGHKEITELLIKNGADVNARDNNGWTSLYDSTNPGWTALHYAAVSNHKEIAELLISKGADINAKDKEGGTALYAAADKGNKEIAELLIKNEADVNTKNKKNGWTTLYAAAARGYKEIAELLVKNGADVNAKISNGWTALHAAALEGYKEIGELLIAKGAKANTKDAIGITALHLAAVRGHKETVKLLICNDADVNAKGGIGHTALHFAMAAEDLETAQLLIMHNADLMARDNQGKIPLQMASDKFKDALLAQALMRLLKKNTGIVLLTDLRLWLHTDYPIVEELQQLAEERKFLLCSTMQNKPLETCVMLSQETQVAVVDEERVHFGEKYTREYNGLALDGEGLEAVITASMVKTLEEELKCQMHELFDCIVGTSFGGIVALGLVVASKESDCRLLGTDDLIKFVAKYHNDILSEKLKIKNDGDALKQKLNALFKGCRLSDALTRVIVPCKKKHEAFDFDSTEAQKREIADYYIRDIAQATCSGMESEVTASSEYKNKAAGLLFKKMKTSLDDNERKKLHVLYCAGDAEDEGHNRVNNELTEELTTGRYCRIKPEKIGSFDNKELVTVYKKKGEAAAENFLKGNEPFIRKLRENRARKDKASY